MSEAPAQLMHCMEVWGGNEVADQGVVIAGLDAWVYCRPYKDAVGGGDVYYVSACATGRITRLLIADVSGHGSAVSEIAAQLRTLMRKYVNFLDQTQFVHSLNAQFTALSEDCCFATAVVTTFFAPTNRLVLCNAGHPPPLIYRTADKQWTFLERGEEDSNIPWGIQEVCSYDQFDVTLELGDLVLCYTDSLPEARFADGNLLGQDGLLRIAQTLDVTDPKTLITQLLGRIEAEAAVSGDDVTILLFRPNGRGARIPFRERILAPARILGALARSWRPGAEPVPWPDINLANIGGALFPSLDRRWRCRKLVDDGPKESGVIIPRS